MSRERKSESGEILSLGIKTKPGSKVLSCPRKVSLQKKEDPSYNRGSGKIRGGNKCSEELEVRQYCRSSGFKSMRVQREIRRV